MRPIPRTPARLVVVTAVLVGAVAAVMVARYASILGEVAVAAVLGLVAYGSFVGLRHNWRRNDEWPYNLALLVISVGAFLGLMVLHRV
jgi:hypothetical protein